MSLIKCSECSKEVSDKAPNCPNCGNPISTASVVQATGASVQTTEGTGKKLKFHLLISSALVAVGFIAMILILNKEKNQDSTLSDNIFVFSWLIGIPYYIFIKFKIWWHHK
ncbi:MAG: hypothetical protein AABZ60_18605 [Planctomycetota bacterium]